MRNRTSIHDQSWQALPWLVNGSLPLEQRERVERHLDECAQCAAELQLQKQLHTQLRDGDAVMLAPQASWQKMNALLDNEEEQREAAALLTRELPPKKSPSRFGGWQFAAAAQLLVIVGLSFALYSRAHFSAENSAVKSVISATPSSATEIPRYETLTSDVDVPIASRASGAEFRVVFQRDVAIAEVNRLLQALPAQIVSGPTEAGVYLLALPPEAGKAAPQLLAKLRQDKRVIFAEHLDLAEYQP